MATDNLQDPGWIRSTTWLIFVFILIYLGYTAYLHVSGQHLGYQADALRLASNFMPGWVIEQMQSGGWLSTITAMVIIDVKKWTILIAGYVGAISLLIVSQLLSEETKPSEQKSSANIYRVSRPDIFVVTPAVDKNRAVDEEYLRIDRKKLRLNREPQTAVERLELVIQEILNAHRQWPADPAGHHANVPLYEHSIEVTRKLAERTNDPVARVVGLAHDLGKLLAYRRNDKGTWEVLTPMHGQLSANMVRLLPEYDALSEDDRMTVRFVLKYYHAPASIPAHASSRTRSLLQKLRFADSLTTHENQQTVKNLEGDEKTVKIVADTILEVIPSLNINKVRKEEHPDGFTGEAFDFVAVLEYPLRRGLSTHLRDESIVRALALRTDRQRGREHPAAGVILKALLQTGLLLTSYAGVTPGNGRFTVKSGNQTFSDTYLLDRSKIEKIYEDYVRHWGPTPPYPLRVMKEKSAATDSETPPPSLGA